MFTFVSTSTFNLYSHAKHIDISKPWLAVATHAFVFCLVEHHLTNIQERKIWWQQLQCELPLQTLSYTLICILWLRVQKTSFQLQSIILFFFFLTPCWNTTCGCQKVLHLCTNTLGKKLVLFHVPMVKKLLVKQASKQSKPPNKWTKTPTKQNPYLSLEQRLVSNQSSSSEVETTTSTQQPSSPLLKVITSDLGTCLLCMSILDFRLFQPWFAVL